MQFVDIKEAIDDLKAGKMVIVVDDEDRENEGDIIALAEMITPETINFMSKFGRGLICLTLTKIRCGTLQLRPMVSGEENQSRFSTNFMISIESKEGVSTGISAHDRAHTILTAIDEKSDYKDIVMPGHIFPVQAQNGGVLVRAGHTEAGCDLAKIAGAKEPASVIVEILGKDGSMARGKELESFAAEHALPIISINQIIKFRLEQDQTIEVISEKKITYGKNGYTLISYRDHISELVHYSLTKINGREAVPLVRVHVANLIYDSLGINVSDSANEQLSISCAMKRIDEYDGPGAMIIISQQSYNVFKSMDGGKQDRLIERQTGIGAQILRHLGVAKMDLLGVQKSYPALSAYGLEIRNYISY